MPPPPVTGTGDVVALPCASVTEPSETVAVTALLTVSMKVLLAVALFASVTVTVKVVARVTAGVPVMAPVEVFMLNPVGSDGDTP